MMVIARTNDDEVALAKVSTRRSRSRRPALHVRLTLPAGTIVEAVDEEQGTEIVTTFSKPVRMTQTKVVLN
jgi:hypothetical protein